MKRIRARLIVCVFAVLACQIASMSAAPAVLCRGALSAVADLDECCQGLAPGQTCPMHHKTPGAPDTRGSALNCVCSPSGAVLASIVGVAGVLPEPIRAQGAPARVAAVAPLVLATIESHQPPHYPPPRP